MQRIRKAWILIFYWYTLSNYKKRKCTGKQTASKINSVDCLFDFIVITMLTVLKQFGNDVILSIILHWVNGFIKNV